MKIFEAVKKLIELKKMVKEIDKEAENMDETLDNMTTEELIAFRDQCDSMRQLILNNKEEVKE